SRELNAPKGQRHVSPGQNDTAKPWSAALGRRANPSGELNAPKGQRHVSPGQNDTAKPWSAALGRLPEPT
ncbi:MAG: hypothetical protein ACKO38_21425, partial [Planctomycetota bacterium]